MEETFNKYDVLTSMLYLEG